MVDRLSFTLTGRDELSRVMNGTADSADRLRLRLAGITGDADGRLHDLQGRFVAVTDAQRRLDGSTQNSRDRFAGLSAAADKLGSALKGSLISLVPAAIPASAALAGAAAQVATQLGAAGLAAGAYALALKPQISAISDVVSAQDAYDKAVSTSGATSQAAATAQAALQKQLSVLPPATQRAAVAVGILRDNFKDWSDSLSGDVMAPFTKGVAVANDLLPKTSGLVKGASTQFDRLITLVGGEISTPGFDGLADRVTKFSDKTMRGAVDKLTVFLAKADAGKVGQGINEFLDYAHANGPAVWETLEHVGEALIHLLQAGSDVGVSMLDVINALSGIVAAVPPQAIADLLQLAIAIKAVRLAAAGGAAISTAIGAIALQTTAARTAAAGATGPLRTLAVSFGTLSKSAKLAVAGTGLGLLIIALGALSQAGKSTPPDVDKLTVSLEKLAQTGHVSGEAARAFGGDLSGLADSLRVLTRPSTGQAIDEWIGKWAHIDNNKIKESKGDVDSVDKALAGLVQNGHADLAAASLKQLETGMTKNGLSAKELRGQLGDYDDALAGQALEQKLAAESMGLFGDQAQKVQAKLDDQKNAADGLRNSIVALNEVHRQGLDAQADFEASIDDATSAAKKYGNVWEANGGKLDLTTSKGRDAYHALSDLAAKTNAATTAGVEAGDSWNTVNGVFERGRGQLIKNARQMGLNRDQAKALADQILQTPDKTAKLRGNISDLQSKLSSAKKNLASVPDSRKAKVRADIAQLESQVAEAKRQLAILNGSTVTVYINGKSTGVNASQYYSQGPHKGKAHGGLIGRAGGGIIPGFDDGGHVLGSGTPTSDSILMWGSTGEYMVRAAAVSKYGVSFLDALNSGTVSAGRSASRPGLAAASTTTRTATTDRPLIGTLTVQTGPNATADEIVSSALFEARVARRRGVYA